MLNSTRSIIYFLLLSFGFVHSTKIFGQSCPENNIGFNGDINTDILTVCSGSTINIEGGDPGGQVFVWEVTNDLLTAFATLSPDPGDVQNLGIPPTYSNVPGTYYFRRVVSSSTACDGYSDTVVLTVSPLPALTAITQVAPVCEGAGAVISMSGLQPNGIFDISYTIDGGPVHTATSITSDAAGEGSFSTAALSLSDNGKLLEVITVTDKGNPLNCSQTFTASTALDVNPIPPAPTPSSNSPVCVGSALNLTLAPIAGAIYNWSGPLSFSSSLQEPVISNADLTSAGIYSVSVTVNGCVSPAGSTTVVINDNSTINLASAIATTNQDVCINTVIADIVYNIGAGGTGATVSGLPAGVSGIFNAGVFTISGTPTESGVFNYTVTTTGPCANQSSGGTITVNANAAISLTSLPATSNQSVCINTGISAIIYNVSGSATGASITAGALPAGVAGVFNAGTFTISGTPTIPGVFNFTVTTTGPCINSSLNGTLTVNADNTVSITSAAGTDAQVRCINTSLTNITYATTGATGATFSGLPTGVTGNWASNIAAIAGSPTVAGNFNYTVTLTGGCSIVTATGSINVTPNNTISLTSAAGTNAQTVCNNDAITTITYNTTGATGATISGLPAGVTGGWAANTVTISGTPSVAGNFNYTITLTGGCGTITSNGSINVNALPAAAGVTICQGLSGSLTSSAACAVSTPGTAGANFAGTGANSGTGTAWSNPTRVVADDNSSSSFSVSSSLGSASGTSQTLAASQFGFSIPANAVIAGIQVTIGRTAGGGTGVRDNSVQLIKAGVLTGSNLGLTGTDWPTSETAQNYGSSSNLWGTTWTPAEINAANFGVGLKVNITSPCCLTSRTANVDYIRVTVSYVIPGTLQWYTVSSGGSPIGFNSPFNPVGVAGSPLPNTNTPGTTTFYAQCAAVPGCRTPVNFVINPLPTVTGTLNICIGGTTQLTGSASPAASNPWVSGTPSVATVSNTGLVTGVAAGTGVITYTNNNGCQLGSTITVLQPVITGSFNVCIGATSQLAAAGTAAVVDPWVSSNTAVATISNTGLVSALTPGTTTITYTNSIGCTATANITVNDNATIQLTSAVATTAQTLCISTPITPITYLLGGSGTGATVSGLPAGVSGSYNAGTKTYTISGTPTAAGSFNYTVTATGPCINPSLNGSITVQANSSITRTSAAATTSQTICINTAITNIVYTIGGGATAATVTGLPAGVSGSLSGNTFTISGTPTTTAGSPFSYTVTATGPCVNASLSGTITVNADVSEMVASAFTVIVPLRLAFRLRQRLQQPLKLFVLIHPLLLLLTWLGVEVPVPASLAFLQE